MRKCLYCGGNLDCGSARGLCSLCYNHVLRRVRLGLTTWDKHIRAGEALVSQRISTNRGANGRQTIEQRPQKEFQSRINKDD